MDFFSFFDIVKTFWIKDVAALKDNGPYTWDIFPTENKKPFSSFAIHETFDRQQTNKKYISNKQKGVPYAHYQLDIDFLASAQKCYATRHKSKIALYRDSIAVKTSILPSTVTNGKIKQELLVASVEGGQSGSA